MMLNAWPTSFSGTVKSQIRVREVFQIIKYLYLDVGGSRDTLTEDDKI